MMQQSYLSRLAARVLERNRATHDATSVISNALGSCNSPGASSKANAKKLRSIGSQYIWECVVDDRGGAMVAILPTAERRAALAMLFDQFHGAIYDLCLKGRCRP